MSRLGLNQRKRNRLRSELLKIQNGKCFYCGCEVVVPESGVHYKHTRMDLATLDHIMPRAWKEVDRATKQNEWNFVVACLGCNKERGDKDAFEFLKHKIGI